MNKEMLDLNIVLWQTIIDHWENKYHASDYSPFMREYLAHAEGILQRYEVEDEEEEDEQDNDNHSAHPAPGPSSSNPPLSFGAPTSSAPASTNSSFSAPSLSFGATTSSAPSSTLAGPSSSAPSFNFGAATASAPSSTLAGPSSSAPSFNFGSTTSSAPSTTSFQAASNNDDGDDDNDPTANPDDGEVAFVGANIEEDVLFEWRSNLRKKEGNKWKSKFTGILRVYQHKTTKKHRVVIVNEIGTVHFNVGISKGMPFEKVLNSEGKAAYVRFLAFEDATKPGELVMLKVKPEQKVDELHRILKSCV
jgi:hypothetical protein